MQQYDREGRPLSAGCVCMIVYGQKSGHQCVYKGAPIDEVICEPGMYRPATRFDGVIEYRGKEYAIDVRQIIKLSGIDSSGHDLSDQRLPAESEAL